MDPGQSVSHRQSDQTQTVGEAAEHEEGELPGEDGEREEDQGGPGLLPHHQEEVEGAGDAGVEADEVGGETDDVADHGLSGGWAGPVEQPDVVPGEADAEQPAQCEEHQGGRGPTHHT